jgi:outer membrane protein TolC
MRTSLAALLLAVLVRPAPAQPTVRLTLDEATARAVAHLPDVAIHRGAVRLARAAESQAAAAFDPVVRLESRARARTDPLNTLFSGAPEGALAPRITSLGGTASWSRLFTGGATVTGVTSATTERTNNLFALLTPASLTSAAVELRQPLVQGRQIDAARQRIRVTGLDTDRSRARLQQTVLDLVAAVEQAYWTLGAAREEVAVRRRVLALAEAQRSRVSRPARQPSATWPRRTRPSPRAAPTSSRRASARHARSSP